MIKIQIPMQADKTTRSRMRSTASSIALDLITAWNRYVDTNVCEL